MKKIVLISLALSIVLGLVPYAAVLSVPNNSTKDISEYIQTIADATYSSKTESTSIANNETYVSKNNTNKTISNTYAQISVYDHVNDKVMKMNMKDYLCCVICAEMSATAPPEALKAQAVAAYTYTLYKINTLKEKPNAFPSHKGAPVCTDYHHCKAFISKEEAIKKWGEQNYNNYYKLIESAVEATKDKAILYEGKPINAVFHSMSSGITEDAAVVWGSQVPYLKSVDSPADKSDPLYETSVIVPFDKFKETMAKNDPSFNKDCDISTLIGASDKTASGFVKTISIAGKNYSGANVRKYFGLRSSNFDIIISENNIVFKVRGYGHGVGMSQHGAIALAKEGKNYEEILKHYYTGVNISDYKIK